MTTTIPQAQRQKEQKRRKRGLLIWGSVAAIGALITSAAFMDTEWAHIDPMGGARTSDYNLQLSKTGEEGSWDEYTEADPLDHLADTDHALVPGQTVISTYYVRNQLEHYDSNAKIVLLTSQPDAEDLTTYKTYNGSKETATDDDLLGALRFTVTVGDQTVWKNAQYDTVSTPKKLNVFNSEESRQVIVKVKVPNDPGLVQGMAAHLMVRIDGEAVSADTV